MAAVQISGEMLLFQREGAVSSGHGSCMFLAKEKHDKGCIVITTLPGGMPEPIV